MRIFHGLNRFSEDLDFSLLIPDADFSLQPYLEGMVKEFEAMGIQVRVTEKNKKTKTNIDSAFLKADTTWRELALKDIVPEERVSIRPEIKIKLEVDTHPPPGFTTEEKLLLKPFSFYVTCFSLPDLFAGKMHTLLFRKWKDRVKGRDWFDLEWYIQKGIPLHLEHLAERARNSGDWRVRAMTADDLMKLLNHKIESVSFARIKEDIVKFIPDARVLEIWSASYFHDLVKKMKIS